MNSRLKDGGIATFWLPISQLKVDEVKAILRAFHNAFRNSSVWASADEQWIMMGIKGQGRAIKEEEIGRLWSDSVTSADLSLIGLEVPQQLGALFLMDRDEIDRLTHDIAPLTDIYPKRLTDKHWDEQASHRFALPYMEAKSGHRRRTSHLSRALSFVRRVIGVELLSAAIRWPSSMFISASPHCERRFWKSSAPTNFDSRSRSELPANRVRLRSKLCRI